jgi:imidazoleglycerol-phosphate dehydratase
MKRKVEIENTAKRSGRFCRKTDETDIQVDLSVDGNGTYSIATSIPFLDHMLSLFAKHGFFDLEVRAAGDTNIDFHHTVEDVGICLGHAFREALTDKKGIKRFGSATVPMIDALASVYVDYSGRSHLVFRAPFTASRLGEMDVELFEEFFRAFADSAGLDLHIHLQYGTNVHHCIEAIFKATARAMDAATRIDPRQQGIHSTKGTLDP